MSRAWTVRDMTDFLRFCGINPDTGERERPRCPECFGEGVILGWDGNEPSERPCERCVLVR
jgi:hypothetical protein